MSQRMRRKHVDRVETVLITGATSGIGLSMAYWFARNRPKDKLILVARNAQRLEALQQNLKSQNQNDVMVISQDLAQPDAAATIFETVQAAGLQLTILINNAGSGVAGPFVATDPQRNQQVLQVNAGATIGLTRLFLPQLLSAGGRILQVSSTGAYQPGPYTSVYYASKAFVQSFSMALADELRRTGLSVTVLCPGTTRTRFAASAGRNDPDYGMSADAVAEIAIQGLMARRRLVIPGGFNRLMIFFSKILPARWTAAIVRRIQQPLYENHQAAAMHRESNND